MRGRPMQLFFAGSRIRTASLPLNGIKPFGGWLTLSTIWVPLDKDEGFVKAQISCALREHRLSFQRG